MSLRSLTMLLVCGFLHATVSSAQQPNATRVLREALGESRASVVVLDYQTDRVLAEAGDSVRGAPGSTIKPLLLEYALEHGIVRAGTTIYCRRNLHIGSHSLPCTHPDDQPLMDAERSLAESCNTWFAQLGRRFSGEALEDALRSSSLPHSPVRDASDEKRELIALGLSNVTVTPLELARAYRQLLLNAPANGPVVHGLAGAVSYGMAHPAEVDGVVLLGKTGTASDPGQAWTHGWFAGAIPGRFIVVIYVPHGDGGVAATLARHFVQGMTAR